MDGPLISVLVATRDRLHVLRQCLDSVMSQTYGPREVLVLDDASEQDMGADIRSRYAEEVRWYRSERALGVAGARNRLVRESRGEVLVFLDDDASFSDPDALAQAAKHFQVEPPPGILAFKILLERGDSRGLQVPFSRRALRRRPELTETPQRVSYYVGAAHAIHRTVFERCGPYQDDLVYGEEELDLSYRAVAAGIPIWYVPDVVAHHRPQPSLIGKSSKALRRGEIYYHTRNRIRLAYMYLPLRYLLVYLVVWMGRYGLAALWRRNLGDFCLGLWRGITGVSGLERRKLQSKDVKYLKANFGRLWY